MHVYHDMTNNHMYFKIIPFICLPLTVICLELACGKRDIVVTLASLHYSCNCIIFVSATDLHLNFTWVFIIIHVLILKSHQWGLEICAQCQGKITLKFI